MRVAGTTRACIKIEWYGGEMTKGSMYFDMMTFLQGIRFIPA